MKREILVILDNVRSAHNVGAIFRTADGAGVKKLYLLGITPAPIDRFGRSVGAIKKTALGAADMLPWEQLANEAADRLVEQLRHEGYQIVAVEQGEHTIALHDFSPEAKICYIFGNEVEGVGKRLQELADCLVEIPMQGQKESLNVSVAAGIVLFASACR